jgi:sulfate/thiosulfate transport system permease protein|uniref:Sulfate transport system permease protein CysT n=1 Tax=Choricystis parasitica TaxID=41300 RepID=A0A097KNT9_9CHLO|nr:probable transport protein [Choricystis parasitica]AIT94832.1 probable transport protein [Choricystis parasitica]
MTNFSKNQIEKAHPFSRFLNTSLGTLPWMWILVLSYLGFLLVLPISVLIKYSSQALVGDFWKLATTAKALSAYKVTLSLALLAATINGCFGFLVAWVLVRYNFPGKKIIDSIVDFPFALPTSVAGLTLMTIYNPNGWIGRWAAKFGISLMYNKTGIALAMLFVSFPFVVRTVQPVLQALDPELEEAAWSLGASPFKTFWKVIVPPIFPSFLTGITLAFSRALGEYGAVVVVSSNMPYNDLLVSVLIFQNLEQYEYLTATVIGTVFLFLSGIVLLSVNWFQSRYRQLRL